MLIFLYQKDFHGEEMLLIINFGRENNIMVSYFIHIMFTSHKTKKETPTQMFSCEFCKIFQSTFFTEHLRATASAKGIERD